MFLRRPDSLLRKVSYCPECKKESIAKKIAVKGESIAKRKLVKEEAIANLQYKKENKKSINFIKKSNRIFNSKYGYNNTKFISDKEKVEIECSSHGTFLRYPHQHLSGKGCPYCIKGGFDNSKPGTCYYIKFELDDLILYKIGITNFSAKERLSGMGIPEGIKTTIIQELKYDKGIDARNLEREILQKFKEFKYEGIPIMNNGNSELFMMNVLNL